MLKIDNGGEFMVGVFKKHFKSMELSNPCHWSINRQAMALSMPGSDRSKQCSCRGVKEREYLLNMHDIEARRLNANETTWPGGRKGLRRARFGRTIPISSARKGERLLSHCSLHKIDMVYCMVNTKQKERPLRGAPSKKLSS